MYCDGFLLQAQRIVCGALASIALSATGRQFSARHQSLAGSDAAQAERVSTSRDARPSSTSGILDVVAIASNALAPVSSGVGDAADMSI